MEAEFDGARKQKIFISGPMRGESGHNRVSFNRWERKLIEDGGYIPVNPVKIWDGIAGQNDMDKDPELLQKAFDADVREIKHCDAIFMLNGWEKSGCPRKELEYALANGKKVILESDLLSDALKYDVQNLADRIETFTNRFGVAGELKQLAINMTGRHRTLVQSFTSGFVLQFIKKMAENFRADRFDDRNKQAANVCDDMWKVVEGKYGLKEGEDISLPMI